MAIIGRNASVCFTYQWMVLCMVGGWWALQSKPRPLYIYENRDRGVAESAAPSVIVRSFMRPAPRAFGFNSPCSIPAYRFVRARMLACSVVAPRARSIDGAGGAYGLDIGESVLI